GCSPLHFNLAHTGDLAVLGVSRLGPLGVDVETIRPVKDADDLVARFFSPRESESFQRLTSDRKVNAFFNLWTRKEALLKASGEGISGGLNRTEVSFLPGEPARVIAIDEQAARTPWTLEAFTPAVGFVGAVAIRQDGVQFRSWKFRPLARLDVRN
ncbi:MAG TPA: 4'-phosphopantetheinyl transferase superfamily protein, partial [Candidatus Paceibacterota bacterium]|nr:4'-phosphopantetheinyl transferase superfamily protein [Candidatus Paceibacterota bacterium]